MNTDITSDNKQELQNFSEPWVVLPIALIISASSSERGNKSSSHRFSRIEAYLDLVRRQRLVVLTQDLSYLEGGMLELSRSWNWSRVDVKKFSNLLVSLGVAQLYRQGAKYLVTLTSLHGLPSLPAELLADLKIVPAFQNTVPVNNTSQTIKNGSQRFKKASEPP